MRVVLDTNILISGMFWSGNPYKLLDEWRKQSFELIISPQIIEEVIRILRDEFGVEDDFLKEWERVLLENSILIDTKERIGILKHKSDNKFLECAFEGGADYNENIVSGDKHLLELKEFRGIKIIKAKQMLDILNR